MIRIFLAHASEDKIAVADLYNRLKENGFQPWLDKVDLLPGQSWRVEIPKAIKNSQVFIACLSEQSVKKQGYIQREFRMALNAMADRPPEQIFLIPVRLDDCHIPELRQEEYGISLSDYQWVDLFEADGYDRLVKGIRAGFADLVRDTVVDVPKATSDALSAKKLTLGQQMKLADRQKELENLNAKLKGYEAAIAEATDIDIKKSYQLRKDRVLGDIDRVSQEIEAIEQGNG